MLVSKQLFASVVGAEVVQAMIQLTPEQLTVHTLVHRDTTCWILSFVSCLDYVAMAMCFCSAYWVECKLHAMSSMSSHGSSTSIVSGPFRWEHFTYAKARVLASQVLIMFQCLHRATRCLACLSCMPICVSVDGPLKLFGEQASYQKIAEEIESLDGVIAHGLFVNVASTAAVFTNEELT